MIVAHKIALDPTEEQRMYFARAAGTARFAYNWALGEWKRQYAAGEKPSEVTLRRQLNAIKRERFPWMFDVTKCAVQEAIIDVGVAFRNFFRDMGKPKGPGKAGRPKFKKKGVYDSFCAANEVGTFRCEGKRIKLPLIGWIKMREAVRFSGVRKRVTVNREADQWFASIMVDTQDIKPVEQPQEVVGVDLGVKVLATPSRGWHIPFYSSGCAERAARYLASSKVQATGARLSTSWRGYMRESPIFAKTRRTRRRPI